MKPQLEEKDFVEAANLIGCEVALVKAIAEVEAPNGGFCPDDFPTTLFEGHHFHKYTKGQFDKQYPTISYQGWTRRYYGKTWQAERSRLETAISLDRKAAIMSTSWGRFQIMGFNFPLCGCRSPQQFVNRMCESERSQGELFIKYILHERLDRPLREFDLHEFASRYNGPGYAKNKYVERMLAAYKKHKGEK